MKTLSKLSLIAPLLFSCVSTQKLYDKGSYDKADSRALSDRDWAIINGSFNNRPDYNDLYRELSRQIMTQFNFRMRDIYR